MNFKETERNLDDIFKKKRAERDRAQMEKERSEMVNRALEKTEEGLEEEGLIDPKTFENFDAGMIKRDLEAVVKKEEIFRKERSPEMELEKKIATVFEAIIHEQVELNEWLGSDVTTRKASKFDDIFNGIDSIAEFREESGRTHLALAFDVTYTNDPSRKMERIKREIDSGKLSEVKYFESSDQTIKGSLYRVPRVIIGAERTKVLQLIELWLQKGGQAKLSDHPIQLQILDEIALQLSAFMKYADEIGKPEMAEIYSRQLNLVQRIRESKEELYKKHKIFGDTYPDKVFQNIKSQLGIFKS